MDKAKQKLLEQTHQTILKVGFENNDYELVADLISPNFVGFGTALDEKIFGVKDLKALLKRQKEQSKGFEMNVALSTLHTHLSINENTAVYIDEGVLSITTNEEPIEMILRLSIVLEYIENKWLMVHFHSSKPEEVESEKDTWGIETWKEKAEELEKEVALRTADLVLKNRDLAIEAAMERVRARSMAMHSSEELNHVLSVMFQQVEVLGIDAKCAHLTLMDLENNGFSFRISGKNGAANIGEQIIDLDAMPIWKDTVSKWKKAKPHGHQCLVYPPEVLPDLWKLINTSLKSLPAKERIKISDFPNGLFDCEGHTKFGYIGFNNSRPPTEEEISIVIRFAREFERVYQRFLDIQKAEAQAREAQIETALEKVRGQSMAMHNSEQLKDVVREIFDQMGLININAEHAGIVVDYEPKKDWHFWVAETQDIPAKISVPYLDSHWDRKFTKAKKNGDLLFTILLNFEEKNAFYEKLLPYIDGLTQEMKDGYFKRAGLAISTAIQKDIGLYIENFSGTPYTEEENSILLRFAKVFQQTYTRFLDLQKAEDQARESQIQLSLERVRAKSMAMQSSDELHDVIGIVFQQFDNLKIQPVNVFLSLFDREKRILTYRASGKSGNRMPTKQTVDIDSVEAWSDLYNKWINDSSDDIEVIYYPKEIVPDILNLLKDTFLAMPKEDRMTQKDFPKGGYSTLGYTPFGYIGYDHTRPPTEEEKDILKRICTEFGRVYQRFLDIQKAEAQAREAQIEVALERVRSRSLAMHKSIELNEIVSVLFENLKELQIPVTAAGIQIYLEDSEDMLNYVCGENPEGLVISHYRMPYFDNAIINDFKNARDSEDEFFVGNYSKKIKDSFFTYLFDNTEIKDVPKDIKQMIFNSSAYTISMAPVSNSLIAINDFQGNPLSENHVAIIKRFAKVFEQAYIRFLDLQKAEAQSKESQIQLALERVRAKTMAMQHSDELRKVVLEMYKQLQQLDFDSQACNIIIIDQNTHDQEFWVSGFSQELYPESYHVPNLKHPYIQQQIKAWKKGETYEVFEYDGTEKKKFDKIFFSKTDFKKSPIEAQEMMRSLESVSLSTAFTKYGSLQVLGPIPLSEEKANILLRFAKVFDQTYTRFLDLKKAEGQAKEGQIEAALERVRSRTMAMHQTTELQDVIHTVHQELLNLDMGIFGGSFITINDDIDKELLFWGSGGTANTAQEVTLPYCDKPLYTHLLNGIKNGPGFFTEDFTYEEKIEFFNFLFKHEPWSKLDSKEKKEVLSSSGGYTRSYCVSEHTTILVVNHFGRTFTTEENMILKRFANVFEQTYTRFLDLQNSEAQAREANIQLALERLRASTMAMKTQVDLLDVIVVFENQLTSLGINVDTLTVINGVPKGDWDLWLHTPDSGVPPHRINVPYIDTPFFTKSINNIEEYERTGNPIHFKTFNKEEKDEFLIHYFNHAPPVPEEFKALAFAQNQTYVIEAFLEEVSVSLLKYDLENFSEEDIKIFTRFSLEFKQTYTRFLDIKKAEEQARQAQIEVSLERVRSRAMAMHQTDELTDVLCVLFDQFDFLGINPVLTHLTLFDEENQTFSLRLTSTAENRIVAEQYIDINAIEAWKDSFENWKKSEPNTINCIDYEPEIIPMVFDLLSEVMNALPKDHRIYPKDFPNGLYTTQGHFKFGYIGFNHTRCATEEEKDIVVRFAKEFGRTYQRFLDIEKAEVQAREAQIEAALEKVRSRTMAMQKSEELPLAANNLFLQVQELGIPAWSAGYCIWQDDKRNAGCNMSSEGEIQKSFILPSIGEGYDFYTPQEKGERFHIKELGGEALVKHYEFMVQLPNVGEILKELIDAGLELPTFQIFHIVYFKFGYVMFITYQEVPEAHDIFKRFGQVFEQTYTRFLDLERAEAQTREARIEMALEKIRSRTMAMQHSNELRDAAQLLFNEVRALGIPSWSCGYNILSDDKKSAECWMSSEGQNQKPFTLIYEKEESFIKMHDFFKGDDTFLIQELNGTALQKHYDYLKSFPNLVPIFNDLQKAEISLPTHQINHLCKFSKGYLLFITYEKVPEAHDIFKRFTTVFEQTYTRFLDLEQAEARAREAQIQSALERVRSHSMGMQSTADFANVTTEMFNQLRNFGEDLFATGIVFCDKHEGHVEQWHSIPGAGMLSPMIVPIDLDYIHQYRYDQWKAGTTLFSIEIPSDFIEQHFEDIFKLPSAQITLKELESRNAPMPAPPEWEIDYGASFKHGYILASSLKPLENMDILPRFAQVFEQAYIRFLDLQKAEAQARESQIEAALEKVRSRTLAMQKSDELADTSVVVFKELLELGIEPNRLFIGIVKDNGDAIDAWATDEDGSKIEQHFKLYTSKNKSIKKMVDGWKQQKKSAIIDMQGTELQEYFHYLNKVMHIPFIHGLKQKKRVQSIAYFSGGLIGMAAPEEQPEETINLLERFAAVFNLTYTRFNDLKIAEAQAKKAEEDLINLQKAKKNAEEALLELQTTQKQLVQSEKMASLGELTAGIAHEIQNPLNFVNNFSEVSKELLEEMLEEIKSGNMEEVVEIMADVVQNLEKIKHHGQRADGIVKGMLQHSRASGDKKEATDINVLADEYLRLAYHGLRAKDKSFNAELVTVFDESIKSIKVIPQDIGRVILNLLTNAFYAVNEKSKLNIPEYKPTVKISTKIKAKVLEIAVADNGNGMPDSVKEKIFQPFFTTKPTGQGTGLGLSLSYDIITKGHGGELSVETTAGKGTTFNITIPIIN